MLRSLGEVVVDYSANGGIIYFNQVQHKVEDYLYDKAAANEQLEQANALLNECEKEFTCLNNFWCDWINILYDPN